MSEADYRVALDFLAALLPELAASEATNPVRPPLPLDEAASLIPTLGPGRELSEVLASLRSLALAAPLTTTPRFFNQLFSGRDAAATAAEMIAAHLNVSMYTYKAAGPLVLMENALIEHMLEVAGFTGGEGTFTSGGSISNLLALALARNEAAARGGEAPRWALYTSAVSHYSMPKAASLLGLGRGAVRAVATDEQGRMRPEALAAMVRADLDGGLRPLMINATASTTVMGAFDPIEEIAELAHEHGIWLHVDGAWGGSLLLLPERRQELFAGLERCDSLTWDAHKLMGVPLTCSVLLVREAGLLERHLGAEAEYLFQTHGPEHNPGLRSIQCGRRNDPLKLWAAWQRHGDEGFAAQFRKLFALRDHVIARIEAEPRLRMSHAPQGLNVCFEVEGASSEGLCEELNARGLAVVGHAQVNGRSTIRLVIANADQDEAILDQFIDDVLKLA